MRKHPSSKWFLRQFHEDEGGAVFIWFTVMVGLVMGLVGLAIEGASLLNLNSSLQELADAAALAGAKDLNGAKGARANATSDATNYLANLPTWSNIAKSGAQINTPKFYDTLSAAKSGAPESNSDLTASFITVTTVDRGITTSFIRAISSSSTVNTNATATAVSTYVTCAPVQSFACNPWESSETNPGDASSWGTNVNIGNMLKLVAGSGGAAGNWGLLQPPGTNGNPQNNQPPWWSAQGTSSCVALPISSIQTTTSPGNTASKAVSGMNVRFASPDNTSGVDSTSSPIVIDGYKVSGNVNTTACSTTTTSATPIANGKTFSQTNTCTDVASCTTLSSASYTAYDSYCGASPVAGSCPLPRDRQFSQLGVSGAWGSSVKGNGATPADLQAYWTNHHSGSLPNGITTRYQIYQKEVDGTALFTAASEAIAKSAPQCTKSLPAGGIDRRLFNVAIVDCSYWGMQGRSTLPVTTLTAKFFMTEPAQTDGSIFAELVSTNTVNSDGGPVHQIVQLVK